MPIFRPVVTLLLVYLSEVLVLVYVLVDLVTGVNQSILLGLD